MFSSTSHIFFLFLSQLSLLTLRPSQSFPPQVQIDLADLQKKRSVDTKVKAERLEWEWKTNVTLSFMFSLPFASLLFIALDALRTRHRKEYKGFNKASLSLSLSFPLSHTHTHTRTHTHTHRLTQLLCLQLGLFRVILSLLNFMGLQ